MRSRGAEDEEDMVSDPEARAMTDLKAKFGAGILEDHQIYIIDSRDFGVLLSIDLDYIINYSWDFGGHHL